jgi:uncharacterized membrane protein (UPF0127 family)
MARERVIFNETQDQVMLERGVWCANPWCHFRGLMLRPSLPDDKGLIFVYRRPSITQTTIHMFFCFFSIGVVWLDAQQRVVDAKLAKPWRPYYAPAKPAQYFIEARPHILEKVTVGDQLAFR